MRIEELSVGDWVCAKLAKWESDDADTTPPLQVKRIDGIERHNLYVDLFNPTTNTIEHSAFVGDLVPISLTPEILEKNGFSHNGRKWYTPELFTLERWGDVWSIVIACSCGEYVCEVCTIKYVHQLQHALRLAGIQKEIVV